jgi:hypothetical protein
MNSLFISIVLSVFSNIHTVKSSSDTVSQKLTIPVDNAFNSLMVYNNIVVYLTEGDKNEILVRDEGVANNIKFKVTDGVLAIRSKKGLFGRNNPEKIIITVKNINAITIMDDGEVRTIGELSYRNLKLEIYGDGAIYVNTRAIEVNTFIKGLGKIEVKGNFKNTTVNKDAYGNMITIYN